LRTGGEVPIAELGITRWSEMIGASCRGDLTVITPPFRSQAQADDFVLNGRYFDSFLSPVGSSSFAICCDKESRGRGFDVVGAAARFGKAVRVIWLSSSS
jgi:hypothetical protein